MGDLEDTLAINTRSIQSLTFRSDGNVLAHGAADRSIYVWDLVHKKRIHQFEGYPQDFWSIYFVQPNKGTDNGSLPTELLAGGGRDGVIRLWDLHARSPSEPIRSIDAHRTVMVDIAFSPAAGYLASCSGSGVKLWDFQSGELIHHLDGHTQDIQSADFRFDGQIVASGSKDGTIILWDVKTGQRLQTLRTPGPYEGMNITGVTGISEAQRAALKALGAVEDGVRLGQSTIVS